MSTHRGLHSLLNYSNFFIKRKNLESSYSNIKLATRNILINNHLRVVDSCGKIFIDTNISPEGWTFCFLLDQSHLTCHTYTDDRIGKCAIDLFTCAENPEYHSNAMTQLNTFLIENYQCTLDSRTDIPRFL